ncbi:MAG: hypothetical protein ABR987_24240, partial [Terracidiphilus sp.]
MVASTSNIDKFVTVDRSIREAVTLVFGSACSELLAGHTRGNRHQQYLNTSFLAQETIGMTIAYGKDCVILLPSEVQLHEGSRAPSQSGRRKQRCA